MSGDEWYVQKTIFLPFEDKNFEISSKSDVTANGASDNKRSSLLFCVTLASEQTQSTENGRSDAKSQSLNIWDRRFNEGTRTRVLSVHSASSTQKVVIVLPVPHAMTNCPRFVV